MRSPRGTRKLHWGAQSFAGQCLLAGRWLKIPTLGIRSRAQTVEVVITTGYFQALLFVGWNENLVGVASLSDVKQRPHCYAETSTTSLSICTSAV